MDKFFNTNNNDRNIIDKNNTNSTIQDNAQIYTTTNNGGTYLNDVYILTETDLTPNITSTGGNDTLYFTSTIMDDLVYKVTGNDLYVGFNKLDGSVRNWAILKNYMTNSNHSVKYIKTSDSKTISIEDVVLTQGFTTSNNVITGTRLSDSITASSSITTINGGAGNDIIIGSDGGSSITINGGIGSDTLTSGTTPVIYTFNSGDGNDVIYNCKEADTLKFNGFDLDLLIWDKFNEDLIIKYGNNDSITLKDYFITAPNIKLLGKTKSCIYDKFIYNPDSVALVKDTLVNYVRFDDIQDKNLYLPDSQKSIYVKINNIKYIITESYFSHDSGSGDNYTSYFDFTSRIRFNFTKVLLNDDIFSNKVFVESRVDGDFYHDYYKYRDPMIQRFNNADWEIRTLYGGDSNNILKLNLSDKNYYDAYIISGGKGDDYLYGCYGAFFDFHANDGNDIIYQSDSSNHIRVFDTRLEKLTWEKQGNHLIIGHNKVNGIVQDTITLWNYFTKTDNINEIAYYHDEFYHDSYVNIDDLINNLVIKGENELTDEIYGTKYSDIIYGHIGDNVIHGGYGNDTIYGGDGYNYLYGDYNSNKIYGGNSGNTIYGGDGTDRLYGGSENDIINSGNGDNYMYGYGGNDTYIINNLTKYNYISDISGNNEIIVSNTNKNNLILYFDLQVDEDGNILDYLSENMYITSKNNFGKMETGITVSKQFAHTNTIARVTTVDNYAMTTESINQLRQDMAGWLHTKQYESIQAILDTNDTSKISELQTAINTYTNWQTIE